MDNLSHTVAGILAAEVVLAIRRRGKAPMAASLPTAAWVTSALANNLPDADLAYTAVLGGKLSYLLHHRGHTHTIVFALAFGLLITGFFALRKQQELGTLATLAFLGPLLHLSLDGTNNYGVHPFWPLDNRWYYGDRIFILEPLFWACGIPLFFPSLRRGWTRLAWALFGAIGLGLCWLVPAVPKSHAAFVTLLAAALYFGLRRRPQPVRIAVAVTSSACVFALFFLAGGQARRSVEGAVALMGWDLREVVLTPQPTQPLCWEAVLVALHGDEYLLHRGRVAPFPSLLKAQDCPLFQLEEPTTATLTKSALASTPSIAWQDGAVLSLPRLRQRIRQSCQARAFLQFARAPYLSEDGAQLGDLRYDHELREGFAELTLNDQAPCPQRLPPWLPPRAELESAWPARTSGSP